MNIFKLLAMRGYCVPAGDGGSVTDRGDDFTPTDDDTPATGDDKTEGKEAPAGDDKTEAKSDDKAGEDKTEAKSDDKGAGKAEDKKGKGIIPLERHEAVLQRERERREAAERELARFQGGEKVAKTNTEIEQLDTKVEELEAKYTKLLTDGETAQATAVMKEIRSIERQRAQKESDLRIAEATSRTAEQVRFETTRERLETAYPELNPDHEDFDDEKTETVVDLMQAYQLKGMTPTEAMQKAVRKVMGVEGSRQAAATTVKPRVDADKVEERVEKEVGKGAERKAAAIDKALETAGKQPPSTDKAGLDSDKAGKTKTAKDVIKMSEKEFGALSKEDRARMRGDEVDA